MFTDITNKIFGSKYYYCARSQSGCSFECVNFINADFQKTDKEGALYFKDIPYTGTTILYYHCMWPEFMVRYFLYRDLSKIFCKPTIKYVFGSSKD